MSKGSKALIGILTFLPIVLGLAFMFYYLMMIKDIVLSMPQDGDPQIFLRNNILSFINTPIILLILSMIGLHIFLLVYYIVHAAKYSANQSEKVLWILLFIFIGTIAFIIYFFMKIIPAPAKPIDEIVV